MSYQEWIAFVDQCRLQYIEGAITGEEYFNAVIAKAVEVNQTIPTQK